MQVQSRAVGRTTRDAIVVSGWTWEAFNVPERIALAIARSGSRVLYCENPVSLVRQSGRHLLEVEKGVFAFGPVFFGHRLNSIPILSRSQAILLANQILVQAGELKLAEPLFIYPHGRFFLALAQEFKRRGFPIVHVCMDYELSEQTEHVRLSDVTLAIPRAAFEQLRVEFGEKVRFLPQLGSLYCSSIVSKNGGREPADFSAIPRPRLGYLGNVQSRLSLSLLRELLFSHPTWQFLSFGSEKTLMLANEHVLSWRSRDELPAIIDAMDMGFLPYDCTDLKNLHCVPLKLFDYFARGLPVVSTPIAYLQDYEDVVYVGATADELTNAISQALSEGDKSPKKARRIAIAREHSLENTSRILCALLADQ